MAQEDMRDLRTGWEFWVPSPPPPRPTGDKPRLVVGIWGTPVPPPSRPQTDNRLPAILLQLLCEGRYRAWGCPPRLCRIGGCWAFKDQLSHKWATPKGGDCHPFETCIAFVIELPNKRMSPCVVDCGPLPHCWVGAIQLLHIQYAVDIIQKQDSVLPHSDVLLSACWLQSCATASIAVAASNSSGAGIVSKPLQVEWLGQATMYFSHAKAARTNQRLHWSAQAQRLAHHHVHVLQTPVPRL